MIQEYVAAKHSFKLHRGLSFPVIWINEEVDLLSSPYLYRLLENNFSTEAICNSAHGIIELYRFCEAEDIDLVEKIKTLDPWQGALVIDLFDFVKEDKKTGEFLGANAHKAKMNAIKEFLLYWWDVYQARLVGGRDELHHAKNKRADMVRAFENMRFFR